MNIKIKQTFIFSFFIIVSFQIAKAVENKQGEVLQNSPSDLLKISENNTKQNHFKDIDSETLGEQEKLLKKIELENALNRALLEQRLTREFANDKLEIEKLKMTKELISLKHEIDKEKDRRVFHDILSKNKDEKDLIQSELELAQAKMLKELGEFNRANIELQKKIYELAINDELVKVELESKKNRKRAAKFVSSDCAMQYTEHPFQKNGKLLISDRKIELNGVISPWKANYIEKALNFYNNKNSKYPIFLIIESSPGGSVSAGDRILRAIKSSKAPVYVVLKSFAASMAAVIVTMADNSYAYPNARILHHQPHISGYIGRLNVREAKEEARQLEEVFKRLLGPVAKKMGITLEDLDRKFYEKSIGGDWMEYADDAKKLKWVNELVLEIDDSSIDYLPSPEHDTLKKYVEEFYRYGFDGSDQNSMNSESFSEYLSPFDYNYSYQPNKIKI